MITGTFSITKPVEVDVTLTITMPLREWIQLRQQLQNEYPGWKVGAMIDGLVQHARQSFTAQIEVQP